MRACLKPLKVTRWKHSLRNKLIYKVQTTYCNLLKSKKVNCKRTSSMKVLFTLLTMLAFVRAFTPNKEWVSKQERAWINWVEKDGDDSLLAQLSNDATFCIYDDCFVGKEEIRSYLIQYRHFLDYLKITVLRDIWLRLTSVAKI